MAGGIKAREWWTEKEALEVVRNSIRRAILGGVPKVVTASASSVNIETKMSWRHVSRHQRQSEAIVATLARKKGIVLTSNVSVRAQRRRVPFAI